RPESVSMLMAALAAAVVLDLAARPRTPALRLAGLTALTALWANLHAGALLVPGMAALAALGAAVERLVGPRDAERALPAVPVLAASMLLSAAGLLVNPWGYRLYLVPLQIGSALDPANLLNPEWLAPTPGRFPLFFTVAAVCALIAIPALVRRRPAGPSSALLLLMFAGMGMTSVRHIGLFFAVLPVAAARLFAWRDGDPPSRVLARAGGWALCGVAAIVMVFAPPAGAAAGIGLQPGRFPERAAEFIDKHLPDARLYNDVAFGGYLIWRGYPLRQVFIDGRNEVHGPLLEELSAALDDGARWSRLLDGHGVEGAVIGYREDWIETRNAVTGEASRGTFSELHFPRNGWSLVYWDDLAMVFVRRGGRHQPVAVDLEYRWVRPEAFRLGDREPAGGPGGTTGRQAAGEVARKLEEDASCLLALEMATVYGVSGPSTAR
ncbi:MAG TPA: hypothetical protein VFP98_08275, partial [Candidatus Polarisedimenticolia bacterium]|nr:hypothetical protein [Candidatus Polarisedimenticolia bacterium]